MWTSNYDMGRENVNAQCNLIIILPQCCGASHSKVGGLETQNNKMKNTNNKIEYYVVDENLKIIEKFRLKQTANCYLTKEKEWLSGKLEILPVEVYEYQKSEKKEELKRLKNDV